MRDIRLAVRLGIAILSAALPAAARDAMAKDGRFTVCAFQDFDKCRLLTASALRAYRFTAENKRVLKALKRYAAAPGVTLAELERAFGKSSKIIPHGRPGDDTVAWFHNSVGLNDLNAKCPECGIYVRLADGRAISLNYIVDGKFTLAWNRAGPPPPPR